MSAPQIDDALLRAQIHTDVQAALTGSDAPVAIHDDRPRLSKKLADLPYAVVRLDDFRQSQAGLKRVTQTYVFEIAYVAALPSTGVLNTQKIALANLLIAQLMGTNLYAGLQTVRMVTRVVLGSGEQNDAGEEPTYEISLFFEITADARY